MTAIDENGKLDGSRTTDIHKSVKSASDRATGEQHIVNQNDVKAVDVEIDLR